MNLAARLGQYFLEWIKPIFSRGTPRVTSSRTIVHSASTCDAATVQLMGIPRRLTAAIHEVTLVVFPAPVGMSATYRPLSFFVAILVNNRVVRRRASAWFSDSLFP